MDNNKISHLAMVFKVVLDPRAKSAHKASRPIRKGSGICIQSSEGMRNKASTLGDIGPGKKRRLDCLEDPILDSKAKLLSGKGDIGCSKKICFVSSGILSSTTTGNLLGGDEDGRMEDEGKGTAGNSIEVPPSTKSNSVLRRLGKPEAVNSLRRVIRSANPDVIFLMETKKNLLDMEDLWNRLGFLEGFAVSADGNSGGLALFWRRGWDLHLITADLNKIIVRFGMDRNVPEWIGCFTYAPPRRSLRSEFWKDLSVTMGDFSCPWMVMGDLNSVLSADEKSGGRPVTRAEGQGLRDFMFKLGGNDLEGVGALFTWSNGQSWDKLIREKLDRVVVSASWISYFKKAGVRNLAVRHSDHGVIVMDTRMDREVVKTPFRYLDAWSRDPGCRRIIEEAWSIAVAGFQSFRLCHRLRSTAKALCKWNREVFGHCQFKLQALERLLSEVQSRDPSQENVELEGTIMLEIDEVEKQLESIWKQKSRECWLKEGDCNSRFFHASIAVRRKRNFIWAIREEDGSWIEGRDPIGEYFRSHFMDLFTSSNPVFDSEMERILEPCISHDENFLLSTLPTSEEIKKVVWSMPPLKSLGPDGFPTKFF
uniref:Endonuclease/exonuclease/phosphatase domain-containing protein n=1 Tax=Cannabis sativa TaxID=3483 RepID=A0A803NGA8_CANSA